MQQSHDLIEAAWAAHRLSLVRRMTALTRDPGVAEDLVQEAFLRLTREVAAGRTPNDPAAWLHRVATNLVASRGRHLTVVDRRAAEIPRPDAPATPEAVALRAETAAALCAVLAELSSTDRDALILAAHGYRGHEIAASLGRSSGATRTLLCRARGKVRGRLELSGFSPA